MRLYSKSWKSLKEEFTMDLLAPPPFGRIILFGLLVWFVHHLYKAHLGSHWKYHGHQTRQVFQCHVLRSGKPQATASVFEATGHSFTPVTVSTTTSSNNLLLWAMSRSQWLQFTMLQGHEQLQCGTVLQTRMLFICHHIIRKWQLVSVTVLFVSLQVFEIQDQGGRISQAMATFY